MIFSEAAATWRVNLSISPKSRLVIALLSCPLLLGIYGLHRIYLGDYWWGLLRLLAGVVVTYQIWRWNDNYLDGKFASAGLGVLIALFAILTIWTFVDFILVVIGKTKDANGLLITRWW